MQPTNLKLAAAFCFGQVEGAATFGVVRRSSRDSLYLFLVRNHKRAAAVKFGVRELSGVNVQTLCKQYVENNLEYTPTPSARRNYRTTTSTEADSPAALTATTECSPFSI